MNHAMITGLFVILTENIVITHLLGIPSPADDPSQKPKNLLPQAFFVLLFSAAGSWLMFFLSPLLRFSGGSLFHPLALILLTSLLAGIVLIPAAFLPDSLKNTVRVSVLEAGISSALLGTLFLGIDASPTASAAAYKGLMQGIGYFVAACLLQAAVPFVCDEKMPARFRGWRGLYLYAAVLSMSALCLTNQTA